MKVSARTRKAKKRFNTITWIGCAIWLVHNVHQNRKKNRYTTDREPAL